MKSASPSTRQPRREFGPSLKQVQGENSGADETKRQDERGRLRSELHGQHDRHLLQSLLDKVTVRDSDRARLRQRERLRCARTLARSTRSPKQLKKKRRLNQTFTLSPPPASESQTGNPLPIPHSNQHRSTETIHVGGGSNSPDE